MRKEIGDRNACISMLRDFYQKGFAELFFSSHQSESEFVDNFPGNEYHENQIKITEGFFDESLQDFDDEIIDLIKNRDEVTINLYFEELKEFRREFIAVNQEKVKEDRKS